MNQLQIFSNSEFGEIRTLQENGKPLFCGSDIAKALGYSNERDAIARHCKGVVKRDTPTSSGNQQMSFITESDVYRLVFGSKLPNAETFTDWVTEEVLPTIRKTGAYSQPMSQIEVLQSAIGVLAEQDKRLQLLESNNERLENKIHLALEKPIVIDWRKWINGKINTIVETEGMNHQTYRGGLYKELEGTARCNLEARQTQLRRRMRESGHTFKECQAVSKLHVIEADPKLKAIFENIVSRESARCA